MKAHLLLRRPAGAAMLAVLCRDAADARWPAFCQAFTSWALGAGARASLSGTLGLAPGQAALDARAVRRRFLTPRLAAFVGAPPPRGGLRADPERPEPAGGAERSLDLLGRERGPDPEKWLPAGEHAGERAPAAEQPSREVCGVGADVMQREPAAPAAGGSTEGEGEGAEAPSPIGAPPPGAEPGRPGARRAGPLGGSGNRRKPARPAWVDLITSGAA